MPSEVVSARAYLAGLGYHRLFVDGVRVGDARARSSTSLRHVLQPRRDFDAMPSEELIGRKLLVMHTRPGVAQCYAQTRQGLNAPELSKRVRDADNGAVVVANVAREAQYRPHAVQRQRAPLGKEATEHGQHLSVHHAPFGGTWQPPRAKQRHVGQGGVHLDGLDLRVCLLCQTQLFGMEHTPLSLERMLADTFEPRVAELILLGDAMLVPYLPAYHAGVTESRRGIALQTRRGTLTTVRPEEKLLEACIRLWVLLLCRHREAVHERHHWGCTQIVHVSRELVVVLVECLLRRLEGPRVANDNLDIHTVFVVAHVCQWCARL